MWTRIPHSSWVPHRKRPGRGGTTTTSTYLLYRGGESSIWVCLIHQVWEVRAVNTAYMYMLVLSSALGTKERDRFGCAIFGWEVNASGTKTHSSCIVLGAPTEMDSVVRASYICIETHTRENHMWMSVFCVNPLARRWISLQQCPETRFECGTA